MTTDRFRPDAAVRRLANRMIRALIVPPGHCRTCRKPVPSGGDEHPDCFDARQW